MANKLEIIINADGTRSIKALKEVGATAAAAGKQSAEASKIADLARKFEGQTIAETSVKIVEARRKESAAAADYSKILSLIRKGSLDEAAGVTLSAAAYEKLAAAKRHALELAVPESRTGLNSVFRERVTEHLGEFGITESMAGMTAAVVGGTVVLGELANKMREVISQGLEFGEMMERASLKTGLSVETLSILHYAAKATGGDFDGMTKAAAKMGAALGEAADGGNKKAAVWFRSLGLDVKQLANQTDGTEIAFRRVAEAMSATVDPAQRLAMAKGVLGKAGSEEIATLMQVGSNWDEIRTKAEATGNVLSGQTAKQLEETNKKLKEMGMAIEGAGLSFTEGFTPGLSKMLDVLASGKSHLDLFKSWGDGMARTLATLTEGAFVAASAFERLWAGPSNLLNPHRQEELASARDLWDKAQSMYQAETGKGPSGVPEHRPDGAPLTPPPPDLSGGGGADKAAQKRLKMMEETLNDEKIQYGVSAKAEYDYWTSRQHLFVEGSSQYESLQEKRKSLAVQGARKASEEIKHFKDEQLRAEADGDRELERIERANYERARDRYNAFEDERKGMERVGMEHAAGNDARRQFQLSISSSSDGDVARQLQTMHRDEAQRQMTSLANDHSAARQNPYLTDDQRARQLKALDEQIARLEEDARLRDAEDEKRIESTTLIGGMNDAIRNFIQDSTNAGAQLNQWFTKSLNSTNDAIVRAMSGEKANFGDVGHEIFKDASDRLLKGAEGSFMKMLFGKDAGTKHDGSSESAALWVRAAGSGSTSTGGSMGDLSKVLGIGLPGMPEYKDEGKQQQGGLVGGLLGKLLHHGSSDDESDDDGGGGFLGWLGKLFGSGGGSSGGSGGGLFSSQNELLDMPGFADGTDFAPGGPAVVGERGPEIVNLPRGSSVTPNHQAFGNNGHTINFHPGAIQAGDNADPEAIHAAAYMGTKRALAEAGNPGLKYRDAMSRLPSTRR